MNRAYSLLTVKGLDTERRVFTGTATTPEPDRIGDIVEPLGVRFKNPLPLLLFHAHSLPVGTVKLSKPTEDGIEFEATLPNITEPGNLKSRVDEAWESIKHGLIRGVSIGFRALDDGIETLKTGGLRFTRTEVLELSLVPVPANADCTINALKSYDAEHLAASGRNGAQPLHANTPGVSGTPVVRLLPTRLEKTMQSLSDQITSYKSTRDQKFTERNALMTKAAEAGVTLDEAESQQYDTLDAEIKALDTHVSRLESMQQSQKAQAVPVTGNGVDSHAHRGGVAAIHVTKTLPPGIEFARAMICKVLAYKDGGRPLEYATERYPDNDRVHAFLKAAIPGGTTVGTTWASPLVDPTNLSTEFIEYLRPETIIGKFGMGGIPSLRRIPFNVRVTGQTSGGDAYWVGEGAPKPLTKFDFSATTLGFTKIASIAVLTEELVRFSSPSAEALVRDALVAANVERADIDFIDPSVAAVAAVSPASITNGLTALAPSGTTADAARADVARVLKEYLDANNTPNSLVLIMPMSLAMALSVMVNSLGQSEFPNLTMRGGSLLGIPVITTQYAANASGAGNLVIAVNASDVFLADDGQVTVDVSREASLQMLDNPTNSSATATATTMVSLWQTDSIGLRAHRFINWAKRRTNAVVYMDDVNWGSVGSPA